MLLSSAMRLYKFLDKKFALRALHQRRLKIARLTGLNDPFEMLPFDYSDRVSRLAVEMMLPELDERAGWICFSRSWANPVVWAHYADQHRGICLGYDVPDDFCQAIIYVEGRKPFPDLMAMTEPDRLAVVNAMLFTKFADWRYEDEIRVTVKLDQETKTNGLFFKDFGDDLKLAEIIVGIRSQTCRREIDAALEQASEANIMRAQAASDCFAIVPSSDAVRNHDDLTYYTRRRNIIHPIEFHREPGRSFTDASGTPGNE
jgi:hypothetical protein